MKTYIDYCPSAPVSINTELITVPSGPPYVVETEHNWIVDDSSIEIWENNDKSGTHLIEEAYDGSVSGSGKYQVDYLGASEGDAKYCNKIFFHADQGGLSFYVWYKTEGDVFGAKDANSKALKDSDAVAGNLAKFDANGNPVDSGIDPDTKADKDSDAVENNLAKFDSSGNPIDSGIASNTVPIATTADLTFYVNSSTGSDENDGSSGSPFATIAKAISLIPQIVNHEVTINLADGSYSEGITLEGYIGNGSIRIMGNTTTPTDVVISGQVFLTLCTTPLTVTGLKTTYVGESAFAVSHCLNWIYLDYLVATDSVGANTFSGLSVSASSHVRVNNSTFSNKYYGISLSNTSSVFSSTNSGTGNNTGLRAVASIIFKNGAQPGGTTAESKAVGGQIW